MTFFKKIKNLWMAFAHVFGQVQTTVLLSVVYHLAIGPIAFLSKILRKDLLALQPPKAPSYAAELPELAYTPERAKRQF
jgi:hypothetical protein